MRYSRSANSAAISGRFCAFAFALDCFVLLAVLDLRAQSNAPLQSALAEAPASAAGTDSEQLVPGYLRCEYLQNPLGVETRYGLPRFFWVLQSSRRAQRQLAYQILVASSPEILGRDRGDLWDSGKVSSGETTHIEYGGASLQSDQRLWWKVRCWDCYTDRPSQWSTNATFEMGLLSATDWRNAFWIGVVNYDRTQPCPMFRSPPFVLDKQVQRATLHASAKGVYELWLNGQRIGPNLLAPEWTDYRTRIQYQSFDVTTNLLSGSGTSTNVIGAIVGEGWYSDTNAFPEMKQAAPYGAVCPQLAVVLTVWNSDGSTTRFTTSKDWTCSTSGPTANASIYGGELYDATREGASPKWTLAVQRVVTFTNSIIASNICAAQMLAQPNEPIQITQIIQPKESWNTTNETGAPATVYDLGQNIVGWCSVSVDNAGNCSGQRIRLRHAERLKLDAANRPLYHGGIDTHNLDYSLGSALQTDSYILGEEAHQEFRPHFTYHGFRYVEVSAPASIVATNLSLSGCVIHSGAPRVGQFACSNAKVTKLMQNILWTIRGNLYGVMTDAPQRGEREGYLGSEMLVSQTACFHFDLASFYTKWLRDIRDAQDASGAYSIYAPWNDNKYAGWDPGWQVGGIVLPWQMYLNYGDTRVLEEHYQSATNWMRYLTRACPAPNYVWASLTNPPSSVGGNNISYGDWLNGDAFLDYPFGWPSGGSRASIRKLEGYGTAWAARSADILAAMSAVLQQRASARHDSEAAGEYAASQSEFAHLATKLRCGYTNDANGFVTHNNDGNIGAVDNNCQGGCVMALYFDMVPREQRPRIASQLVHGAQGIENYNREFSPFCTNHLSTGNQFAAREMLELTRNGYSWKAFEVLTNTEFPSWMYWVENGATTCWERWNSYLSGPGRGRGYADYNEPRRYSQRMSFNSFNSLPFAAVGEWVWKTVGGINLDEANPGFRNIIIYPQSGAGINWCCSSLNTIRGPITSAWTNDLSATNATIAVMIPANTTACLYLPSPDPSAISEAGRLVAEVPGVLGLYATNLPNCTQQATVLRLGSGNYNFIVSNATFQVQSAEKLGFSLGPAPFPLVRHYSLLILCAASTVALLLGILLHQLQKSRTR